MKRGNIVSNPLTENAGERSLIDTALEHLLKQVGAECSLQKVARLLCGFAERMRAPTVGAMHVACADELERACVEAFQHGFVQHVVPSLRFGSQSAFRIANLGGRYEQGAIAVAEHHFAVSESADSYKLMVVKINSHVGVVEEGGGAMRYGTYLRFGEISTCCGALEALLTGGGNATFLDDLTAAFNDEGIDRLGMLRDEQKVPAADRSLMAAVIASLMQARRAMGDIREHRSVTPTLYVVAPCVTLNRADRDTEIVCGVHVADHRTANHTESYFGLGDDPSRYGIGIKNQTLHIVNE